MLMQAAVPGVIVFLVQRVLDQALIAKDAATLAALPVALAGLYALNGALTLGRGMLTRAVAWDVVTRLRHQVFEALLRQELGWHQQQPTGELVARLNSDVNNVQYAVSGVVTAIQKPVTLVVLAGSALYLNPKLAMLALIVLPIVVIPIDRLGRRMRVATRQGQDSLAHLSANATETLSGMRTVAASQGEAARLARFEASNEEARQAQLRAFVATLLPGPVVELVASICVGLVLWIGGQQVLAGTLEPGALIAFLVALGLLNEPLKGVAQINTLIQRALASAELLYEIIDRQPLVQDTGTRALQADQVEVELRGLSFAYPARAGDPSPALVLRDIDLALRPGRTTALVGSSGSGKSTLASLLPRFLDPTQGAVLINGVDARQYTLSSLRAHIALVTQDPFLWDDTVRENIRFGLPQATDDAVERAAQAAGAHDFILALPAGYDTRIDELGARLSGGQRQRICIARALLRDAPLLILDEATSALDAETEAEVSAALARLMVGRTVLAIAHRLSTVQDADEIVVLEAGRVVERGPHEALLARAGAYARLVRRQQPGGRPSSD